MIIIADSGSTKTDWRFIDSNGNVTQAKSEGINPNYMTEEEIKVNITSVLKDYKSESVKLYFYGAGCKAEKNVAFVHRLFMSFFFSANVYINHDMFGAARSLCGHDSGIACILGTGSNSCLYDGQEITANVRSLGYLLGDEGSGSYIGKKLLQNYFRGNLSSQVTKNFEKRFGDNQDELIREIYNAENSARYISKFSKFVFQNIKDPGMYKMVYSIMVEFLELNVQQYEGYETTPVHFTGSVAYYFSNILRKAGQDKGITIGHVVESPIAGLTLYHKEESIL
ncbi:BadF/BadG/BcrA/BcrD ATPase family protein [Reichenbachiella versicolor]|uniref:BadF/BadG/BcrA/BcrD ATPase family protein n=1 Tax=Reichenbachiella versicolor TaxID=1821036 RepID=UPI000D6E0026|nr:BadF/BadG/BcrA/BcrD ATPase family protein [Reichenbachiella versicolor]